MDRDRTLLSRLSPVSDHRDNLAIIHQHTSHLQRVPKSLFKVVQVAWFVFDRMEFQDRDDWPRDPRKVVYEDSGRHFGSKRIGPRRKERTVASVFPVMIDTWRARQFDRFPSCRLDSVDDLVNLHYRCRVVHRPLYAARNSFARRLVCN